MTDKKIAEFGTWESPITAEILTGKTVGLSAVTSDGDKLYWIESRPEESGRNTIMRRLADGLIEEITPTPINVGNRVHEYGGGEYHAEDNRVIFSNKTDGSVWISEPGEPPRKIISVKGCMYADFRFIPGTNSAVAVREDHREQADHHVEPTAAIVSIDLSGETEAEDNEGTPLVTGPDFLSSPRPSPDGRLLSWISWDHPNMPWDSTKLWIAPLGSNGLIGRQDIVAGDTQAESIVQPTWSPDGTLYFCSDRNEFWNIYRLRSEGFLAKDGIIEPVTELDAEIGGPHWVFGEKYFDFLQDGSIIAAVTACGKTTGSIVTGENQRDLGITPASCPAILTSQDGTQTIGYLDRSQKNLPAVTIKSLSKATPSPETPIIDQAASRESEGEGVVRAAGAPIMSDEDVSEGELICFDTSDEDMAFAFWYPPQNGKFSGPENEKPPLVVMIHGGPTAMAYDSFSPKIQWWTSRGFGVVDVNYRGSTGFGRTYRNKLEGGWGAVDVEDCIAAAKYLISAGKVDGEKVAIRGSSAGGFTALAALTKSSIFKAAASLYGIGDLTLLAGDTHKFEARYLDRLVGPLPDSEELYEERSPINHANDITAGVIFFQGLDDKVVPPNQARAMAEALQNNGLPTALYEYEGEGHGFRKGETQRSVLNLELGFYAKMFGIDPPGMTEKVELLPSDPPGNGPL